MAPFALPPLVVILAAFYLLYAYFQASVRQVCGPPVSEVHSVFNPLMHHAS